VWRLSAPRKAPVPAFKDLTAQVFGRLTAVRRVPVVGTNRFRWECRCACGRLTEVAGSSLKCGTTRSCGCLSLEVKRRTMGAVMRKANTRHGMSATPEFRTWSQMLDRCHNPNNKGWANYGGRGITVCPRWRKSFKAFFADMGERPPGLTLERTRNSGGYSPGNCVWATRTAQQNNTRATRVLRFAGKSLSVAQWAVSRGINERTLRSRLRMGWSVRRALTASIEFHRGAL
jgi:hypothetical protein